MVPSAGGSKNALLGKQVLIDTLFRRCPKSREKEVALSRRFTT